MVPGCVPVMIVWFAGARAWGAKAWGVIAWGVIACGAMTCGAMTWGVAVAVTVLVGAVRFCVTALEKIIAWVGADGVPTLACCVTVGEAVRIDVPGTRVPGDKPITVGLS